MLYSSLNRGGSQAVTPRQGVVSFFSPAVILSNTVGYRCRCYTVVRESGTCEEGAFS